MKKKRESAPPVDGRISLGECRQKDNLTDAEMEALINIIGRIEYHYHIPIPPAISEDAFKTLKENANKANYKPRQGLPLGRLISVQKSHNDDPNQWLLDWPLLKYVWTCFNFIGVQEKAQMLLSEYDNDILIFEFEAWLKREKRQSDHSLLFDIQRRCQYKTAEILKDENFWQLFLRSFFDVCLVDGKAYEKALKAIRLGKETDDGCIKILIPERLLAVPNAKNVIKGLLNYKNSEGIKIPKCVIYKVLTDRKIGTRNLIVHTLHNFDVGQIEEDKSPELNSTREGRKFASEFSDRKYKYVITPD